MRRILGYALVACLAVVGADVRAQDIAFEHLYDRGLQAYFARDYARAVQTFSAAVQNGSTDPRVFYFRGLAEWNLGQAADARKDFAQGAKFESSDSVVSGDMGRSLERVQGRVRMQLESYRAASRIAAAQHRDRMRMERYLEFRQAPASGAPAASPAATSGEGMPGEEKPAAQPKATEDPFATPAAPAEAKPAAPAKAADDPFATPAAPTETKPAAPPAEKKAEADPFGT